MIRTKFSDIIEKYDAILLDSYGVIKNYQGLIEGAAETLKTLRKREKRYRILTNDASSSQERLAAKFEKQGIAIRPHRIITSGLMAQRFLESQTVHGKILYFGTEDSSAYIVQAHQEKISIKEYTHEMWEEVGCLVFLDDEGYEWKPAITQTVNLLRNKSVPVIVANSDLLYPTAKNEVAIGTGGIAHLIEAIMGYRFIHFGKPDIQMFLFAYNDLRQDDPSLERSKILMVGDTLETDILGGLKFGVDTALVLTGNTAEKDVDWKIKSTGIVPSYICESIVS